MMGTGWLILTLAALVAGLLPGLLVPIMRRRNVRTRERALALYVLALVILQLVAGLSAAGAIFAWIFILAGFAAGHLISLALARGLRWLLTSPGLQDRPVDS